MIASFAVVVVLLTDGGERPAHATDFETGAAQGTVSWNGTPVTGLRANQYYAQPEVNFGSAQTYINAATGAYSIPVVPLGTYTPTVKSYAGVLIGEGASTTITAGITSTVDFDLTATAGEVTGQITLNGSPLAGAGMLINFNQGTAYYTASGSGQFAWLLPPGSHTATVYPSLGDPTVLGTFSFTIVAGQTTNLGDVFADSDGDGYTDADEIADGHNPNDYCIVMRADTDGDGLVSVLDIFLLAGYFGDAIPPAPPRYDQDGDGTISILDISLQASVFTDSIALCA